MNHRRGLHVYILRSRTDPRRHYVGSAHHVARRLAEHNRGHVRATNGNLPWELVVSLWFPNPETAREFERYLKSGSGRAFAKRHFGRRAT